MNIVVMVLQLNKPQCSKLVPGKPDSYERSLILAANQVQMGSQITSKTVGKKCLPTRESTASGGACLA